MIRPGLFAAFVRLLRRIWPFPFDESNTDPKDRP